MTSATTYPQLTGEYTLDAAHSRIWFVARHAMVTKVRGSFNDFTGTAAIDGDAPEKSSVQVTIQAHSVDTRNADRDGHLKSNDFLAMDEYPQITFSSTEVQQTGDTSFELTKMGVRKAARGLKAGEFLLNAVIARAAALGADPL